MMDTTETHETTDTAELKQIITRINRKADILRLDAKALRDDRLKHDSDEIIALTNLALRIIERMPNV